MTKQTRNDSTENIVKYKKTKKNLNQKFWRLRRKINKQIMVVAVTDYTPIDFADVEIDIDDADTPTAATAATAAAPLPASDDEMDTAEQTVQVEEEQTVVEHAVEHRSVNNKKFMVADIEAFRFYCVRWGLDFNKVKMGNVRF